MSRTTRATRMLRFLSYAIALGIGAGSTSVSAQSCAGKLAMQVLGSGGPVAQEARASSGYLIWMNGHSRVLVDAGGGIFLRFGQSKASIDDLSLVALSHFHADHVADFAALVKSGYFSDRKDALPISGPSGNNEFPSLAQFLDAEFAKPHGAFAYLSGALDGSNGQFKLDPIEVSVHNDTPKVVLETPSLTVMAAPVMHGSVPALGYLVKAGGKSIAFSGDQSGDNLVFWAMIKDADLLVMHHAVPEDVEGSAAKLHAIPSVIGEKAAAANVKQLVLSHLMQRSLDTLPANLTIIRQHYKGRITVASDLQCFPVAK